MSPFGIHGIPHRKRYGRTSIGNALGESIAGCDERKAAFVEPGRLGMAMGAIDSVCASKLRRGVSVGREDKARQGDNAEENGRVSLVWHGRETIKE